MKYTISSIFPGGLYKKNVLDTRRSKMLELYKRVNGVADDW
jgi:hypothetical protein